MAVNSSWPFSKGKVVVPGRMSERLRSSAPQLTSHHLWQLGDDHVCFHTTIHIRYQSSPVIAFRYWGWETYENMFDSLSYKVSRQRCCQGYWASNFLQPAFTHIHNLRQYQIIPQSYICGTIHVRAVVRLHYEPPIPYPTKNTASGVTRIHWHAPIAAFTPTNEFDLKTLCPSW
jgi:hypothetical protein